MLGISNRSPAIPSPCSIITLRSLLDAGRI
jgi:hypothetical protein